MIAVCYTDASYNEHIDIAACGFCVLVGSKIVKHQVILVEGLGSVDKAEVFAVTAAMQYAFLIKGVRSIVINTDSRMIVVMGKLTLQRKYPDLFDTIEIVNEYKIGLTILHVRAHRFNKHNNLVDKSCLENLRKFISENGKEARKTDRHPKRWNGPDNRG